MNTIETRILTNLINAIRSNDMLIELWDEEGLSANMEACLDFTVGQMVEEVQATDVAVIRVKTGEDAKFAADILVTNGEGEDIICDFSARETLFPIIDAMVNKAIEEAKG